MWADNTPLAQLKIVLANSSYQPYAITGNQSVTEQLRKIAPITAHAHTSSSKDNMLSLLLIFGGPCSGLVNKSLRSSIGRGTWSVAISSRKGAIIRGPLSYQARHGLAVSTTATTRRHRRPPGGRGPSRQATIMLGVPQKECDYDKC